MGVISAILSFGKMESYLKVQIAWSAELSKYVILFSQDLIEENARWSFEGPEG
jgi:hypothetical protein